MAPIASFIYNKSLDYFGDVVKDDLKKYRHGGNLV